MHLLHLQSGGVDDGSEAVDLGQDPADVLILSAADTELSLLAQAVAGAEKRAGENQGDVSVRLANLLHLTHPLSVDQWIDKTAQHSRLIIARLLGGRNYWHYGVEELSSLAKQKGIMLALLPGDDKPDADLLATSTLPEEAFQRLHAYFNQGGFGNAQRLLHYAHHLVSPAGREAPAEAAPLLRAGLYWPSIETPTLQDLTHHWKSDAPTATILFYRALMQSGATPAIDALIQSLRGQGINPLPIFVSSLKDAQSVAVLNHLVGEVRPDIAFNTTGFTVAGFHQQGVVSFDGTGTSDPLSALNCPVVQIVLSSGTREAWEVGTRGLSARDIAMSVALPEVDGRIIGPAISFKDDRQWDARTQCWIVKPTAVGERVGAAARLAQNWCALSRKAPAERRVGLILANYPNKDSRLANGVGLDTPAAVVTVLKALPEAGYSVENGPENSSTLMQILLSMPTNDLAARADRSGGVYLSLQDYRRAYLSLPEATRLGIEERWGQPETDPFFESAHSGFRLGIIEMGNVIVGVQPARGYNIDPKETYHSPDLPPPHGYLAFYIWMREIFGIDAVVHMGKHGNLEWLPGKALALSESCFPEAILQQIPNIYPFIVNDPGEGTQAKRRTQAVIIDHLTPPLARAETYGPLRDLEALVDEFYNAAGLDPRRLNVLRREILTLTQATGVDGDAGIEGSDSEEDALQKLDNFLCELKESQIRDGLHVFGQAPTGGLRDALVVALARNPRDSAPDAKDNAGRASILRALAHDLGLVGDTDFDPLDCTFATPWINARPEVLRKVSEEPWRHTGDTVERLELLALALVDGSQPCATGWTQTRAVLDETAKSLRPAVEACGEAEIAGLLTALDGGFVAPGPSGAPTRGRPDVLPTGRNFYAVDNRALPTPAAAELGWKSAEMLVERHVQLNGEWPRSMALTAWGTSNMRTGGDDIAQALALIGVRPSWDGASRRVTGFAIVPLEVMNRPRVDVTLRISGFFRDAFPGLMILFDDAARAVMALDEPEDQNPLAARFRAEEMALLHQGHDAAAAQAQAGFRVFGSMPGAYGAGLQAQMDEKLWTDKQDLADAFITWGGYAYGSGTEGQEAADQFSHRLAHTEVVVQNQDNHEHDLLDSDDYYQFEGGMTAAVTQLSGKHPTVYHNDHSRPFRPKIRTLDEEISRVVRARAVNPKWIAGVRRHGYKGAFEIAATVDYLFAFAATTGAVKNHHFDLIYDAYLGDEEVRDFLAENNAPALTDIAARLEEAIERGLWTPRSNRAASDLSEIVAGRHS